MGLKQKNFKDVRVIKLTHDEWYGNDLVNFEGRQTRSVTVSFLKLRPCKIESFKYRVCIWGNDDFGLEKDFEKFSEAKATYLEVISWDWINKQPLLDMGFINA